MAVFGLACGGELSGGGGDAVRSTSVNDGTNKPNQGCVVSPSIPNRIACSLSTGTHVFKDYEQKYLYLVNETASWLQIDEVQVSARGSEQGKWGEFAVYRDLFAIRQDAPGIGEVGALHKNANEAAYPVLRWGDPSTFPTALSVPPGSTIYISHNWNTIDAPHYYSLQVSEHTHSLNAIRQPKQDPIAVECSQTHSEWSPWVNDTAHNWKVSGATVFAVEVPVAASAPPPPLGPGARVHVACVYIFDVKGEIRWQHCDGLNARGTVVLPVVQTVYPGEKLAGQAQHHCSSPQGKWNWAAYIHSWPEDPE